MSKANHKHRNRFGHKEPSSTTQVPDGLVGLIIGKGGQNISKIRNETGSKIFTCPTKGESGMHTFTCSGGNHVEAIKMISDTCATIRQKEDRYSRAKFTKVYMDLLNFARSRFFDKADDWSIERASQRVKNFAQTCRKQGIEVVAFVDFIRTGEALEKMLTRTTKAIENGERGVPQHLVDIMCELFDRYGIELRKSTSVNNDDTLASHAFHDKVPILSGDLDFQTYMHIESDGSSRPANLEVYSNFKINEEGEFLTEKKPPWLVTARIQERNLGPRHILTPPPTFKTVGDGDDWAKILDETRLNELGAPSPLIRRLGKNPHETVKDLRRACYKAVLSGSDMSIPIRETYPVWNYNFSRVDIKEDSVDVSDPQNALMLDLLLNPRRAFEYFFPEETQKYPPKNGIDPVDWYKHCHGCRVIVIRLFFHHPINRSASFLDMLAEADTWTFD